MQSDEYKFTKSGHYESGDVYDSALLTFLEKALKNEDKQPRLIVLHLLGSHPNFKRRLEKPLHWNVINEDISAYIQTIEQTDNFLKEIYQMLDNQGDTFSMLYFSDHGLTTKNRNLASVTLAVGVNKGGYRVPFFIASSDDVTHTHLKVKKSAFNFINGFAFWLGIEEKSLKRYDFLSKETDTLKVFNGIENIFHHFLEEDTALF